MSYAKHAASGVVMVFWVGLAGACNVEDSAVVTENNSANNTSNNASNNATNNASNNATNNASNNRTNNQTQGLTPSAGIQRCAAAGVATGGGYIATFCAGGDIAGPTSQASGYKWTPGASTVLIPNP